MGFMDCWLVGWLLGLLTSCLGHLAAGLAWLARLAGRSAWILGFVGRSDWLARVVGRSVWLLGFVGLVEGMIGFLSLLDGGLNHGVHHARRSERSADWCVVLALR